MTVVYRLIKYEGDDEWLESQIGHSLPLGKRDLKPGCSITVAGIDPEDHLSIILCRDKFFGYKAKLDVAEKGFGS